MTKRILVVEDQEDNRQIVRDMLAQTDYEISEAENGEEALAEIAKQRPDLILMDIQLPIMDGYDGHTPHQSRSCVTIDPDYCGDVLCPQWRRQEGTRSRMRRLHP